MISRFEKSIVLEFEFTKLDRIFEQHGTVGEKWRRQYTTRLDAFMGELQQVLMLEEGEDADRKKKDIVDMMMGYVNEQAARLRKTIDHAQSYREHLEVVVSGKKVPGLKMGVANWLELGTSSEGGGAEAVEKGAQSTEKVEWLKKRVATLEQALREGGVDPASIDDKGSKGKGKVRSFPSHGPTLDDTAHDANERQAVEFAVGHGSEPGFSRGSAEGKPAKAMEFEMRKKDAQIEKLEQELTRHDIPEDPYDKYMLIEPFARDSADFDAALRHRSELAAKITKEPLSQREKDMIKASFLSIVAAMLCH